MPASSDIDGKTMHKTMKDRGGIGPLPHDPVPWLLSLEDDAVTAFVRRDLLGEAVDMTSLWDLPGPRRILSKQTEEGAWHYPVHKPRPLNYDLYETFNALGSLVYKYGFDNRHPSVRKAAAYVFSCQTKEGDYRGIYGTQPAHTYTPALMEVLIDAGYGDHASIRRAFSWLIGTRQEDGGWAIPARTQQKLLVRNWAKVMTGPVIEADRTKPYSHLITGMALRAFSAHTKYREMPEARKAADLLKARLFRPDRYPDRRGVEYWTKFTFPFQFTDLLTSLDSLGKMGYPAGDPDVARAIEWFRGKQRGDGSFDLVMCRGISDKRLPYWLGLAVCRGIAAVRRGPYLNG